MVRHFLEQIVSALKKGFSRVITDRESNIVSEPDELPVSGVIVRAGEAIVNQAVHDNALSKPHPVHFREEFRVMKGKTTGPYQLELDPINENFSCLLVYHPSKNIEGEKSLSYGTDFAVNEKNEVSFKKSVAKASLFYLDYEVSGMSTSTDFSQDIYLDIYDNNVITAEKYASLSSTILLTNQAELFENYNTLKTGEYGGKRYQSIHRLSDIRWIGAVPQDGTDNFQLRLHYKVEGRIQHIKVIEEGIELIDKVEVVLKEPK